MATRSNSPASQSVNISDSRDSQQDCSLINSIAISGPPEVLGKTTLTSEACHDVFVTDGLIGVDLPVQTDIQDIRSYFERPRLVSSFSVTAAAGLSARYDLNTNTLFGTTFPDGLLKIKGAYGVRFTLVITLQSAHTPFQQGLYALAFQPGITSTATYTMDRTVVPWTSVNLPHVRLDLATDTMVTLRVPYVNTYDFIDPTIANIPYGTITVNSLLFTRTITGSALPTMKLFVSLEDVELIGVAPYATTAAVFQAGGVLRKEQKAASGLFSKPLSNISTALTYVSKMVPALASFTAPAAFYADVLSGIATIFGYARPISSAPPQPMRLDTTAYENNVDLPAVMQVLGPTSTNTTIPHPGFAGSHADEMALAYVLQRPCVICVGNLNTSRTHGSCIYNTLVSPSSFWLRTQTGTAISNLTFPSSPTVAGVADAIIPSGLLYFASMFRFWKGGIKFRITFSKTKFHAGRVMLSFIPSYPLVPTVPGVQEAGYTPEIASSLMQPQGYSQVFDLRDSTIVEFVVPYISMTPFARFFESIGTFSMSIMDPLIVNASVANTVDYMVEVSASDDFQLSVPCGMRFPNAEKRLTIRLQSGGVLPTYKDDIVQYTTGEWLTSLKQLITMPHNVQLLPAGYPPLTDPDGASTYNSKAVIVDFLPWYWRPDNNLVSTIAANSCNYSMQSAISACYAFVAGSTDYHLYVDRLLIPKVIHYSNELMPVNPANQGGILQVPTSGVASLIPPAFEGTALHFRVPSFLHVKRVWSHALFKLFPTWSYRLYTQWTKNHNFAATGMLVNQKDVPFVYPRVSFKFVPESFSPVPKVDSYVRIQAGDDARLGYYLGPVPIWVLPAVTNFTDQDNDMPTGLFSGAAVTNNDYFARNLTGGLPEPGAL